MAETEDLVKGFQLGGEFLEKSFTHEILREKPSYTIVLIDTFKKSLPVG